jgi:hypothetical protein
MEQLHRSKCFMYCHTPRRPEPSFPSNLLIAEFLVILLGWIMVIVTEFAHEFPLYCWRICFTLECGGRARIHNISYAFLHCLLISIILKINSISGLWATSEPFGCISAVLHYLANQIRNNGCDLYFEVPSLSLGWWTDYCNWCFFCGFFQFLKKRI